MRQPDTPRTPGLTFDDLPRLVEQAQAHLAEGKPRMVERLFLESYAVAHKSARFHALVSAALVQLQDEERAEAYLRMAAYLAPSNPQWWLELARLFEAQGRSADAEAMAMRTLGVSPYVWEAWDIVDRQSRSQGRTPPPRLILFGDSHAMYFRYLAAMNGIAAPYVLEAHDIGGGTAYGLHNADSESGAAAAIRRRLDMAPVHARLLFFFGEVDCRRAAWAAAEKTGDPIDRIIEGTVTAYVRFLDSLQAEGHGPITIVGPILPITDDERFATVVRNDPRALPIPQSERTRITDRFCALCRAACAERGWGYIDVADAMRDPLTGQASETFIGDDPWDAHARMAPIAACLAAALDRHLADTGLL